MIDDDPFFRFMHQRLLLAVDPGLEIRMAEDGAAGLQDIHTCIEGAQQIPDYIILDAEMPTMDGREFLQAFRTLVFPGKEKIQIIVVSTSPNSIPLDGYELYKIRSFIKPVQIDQLKQILLYPAEPEEHKHKKTLGVRV
ncbi:response regulator [Chryseolinea lacunae]|uniref:Response regulator n=1 Tax=Chryseolinea lacunae TaxID=2801331 RepID=A0ABS1KXJ0_9BACT|nr:response regulator [Chryseolinea lacunae]